MGRILFLTLKVFSATGGIEKMSRIAGKALHEITTEENSSCIINCLHDKSSDADGKYFPKNIFKGFGGNKVRFVLDSVKVGRKSSVIVLTHINLLSVGYAVKKIAPQVKVILLAHGIEVWDQLPAWKKKMLHTVDLILPVSHFTRDRMVLVHGISSSRFRVLNNCLDPFFPVRREHAKDQTLLDKYGLHSNDVVMMTLTRLASKEKYKGYDRILEVLPTLKNDLPTIKYLLIGKADTSEKERLLDIIRRYDLTDSVILAGFVADEELAAHFELADFYVMPSKKEGFGIVFIEAMHFGLPVIAGNQDGSVDALANGEFGILIDPDNNDSLVASVKQIIADKSRYTPDQEKVQKKFGYNVYKQGLRVILQDFRKAHSQKNKKLTIQ